MQLALDTLIARIADENQQAVLLERKKQMMQAEETIARQVDFDKELRETINTLTDLDNKAQQALHEWKTFALHLNPEARRLLADSMPHEIPLEAFNHMSPRERNTYYTMASNYNSALISFHQEMDNARTLFKAGVRGYTRARISEALDGAQLNIEEDFSSNQEGTQPFQTTERPQEPNENTVYEAHPEDEPVSPELIRARAVAISEWDWDTRKSLAKMIKETRRDISFSDDEDTAADQLAEFLLVQMPDSAKKTLFLIAKLRRSIETAESKEEIEDIQAQKQKLLAQLEPIIRNEDLRNPELIGKVAEQYSSTPLEKLKRGDTTKDDIGTKTLSPEEAEIAEQNAVTDTKAPEYAQKQAGTDTVAPDYAVAEQAKNEAETKNEQFWNDVLALSGLFHEKMRSLTHSELLAHEKTWEHLRKLDSMIVSGKKVSELSEDDKTDLIKAIFQLDYDLRANTSIENYVFYNGDNALKIQNTLDALDVSMDKAIPLAMSVSPEPSAEENLKASYKLVEEQRARQAASEEAETIAIPEPEVAKPRVPKKPLRTAAEAVAAAQRKPRKTPPRSVQSTRPPAIAA